MKNDLFFDQTDYALRREIETWQHRAAISALIAATGWLVALGLLVLVLP